MHMQSKTKQPYANLKRQSNKRTKIVSTRVEMGGNVSTKMILFMDSWRHVASIFRPTYECAEFLLNQNVTRREGKAPKWKLQPRLEWWPMRISRANRRLMREDKFDACPGYILITTIKENSHTCAHSTGTATLCFV